MQKFFKGEKFAQNHRGQVYEVCYLFDLLVTEANFGAITFRQFVNPTDAYLLFCLRCVWLTKQHILNFFVEKRDFQLGE